jgi:hypothetical protein
MRYLVLLSTVNPLVFPMQPLGLSILMLTQDVSLLDTGLYRSNLTLISPSLPMKNSRESVSNVTTTSEN